MVQLPGFEPGPRTWQARIIPSYTTTARSRFGFLAIKPYRSDPPRIRRFRMRGPAAPPAQLPRAAGEHTVRLIRYAARAGCRRARPARGLDVSVTGPGFTGCRGLRGRCASPPPPHSAPSIRPYGQASGRYPAAVAATAAGWNSCPGRRAMAADLADAACLSGSPVRAGLAAVPRNRTACTGRMFCRTANAHDICRRMTRRDAGTMHRQKFRKIRIRFGSRRRHLTCLGPAPPSRRGS